MFNQGFDDAFVSCKEQAFNEVGPAQPMSPIGITAGLR
jgi:hypothetical protein